MWPTIRQSTQRGRMQHYLETYLRPRYPQHEQPLMAAVDAYDEVAKTGRLTQRQLEALVQAGSRSETAFINHVPFLLARLTRDWPEACDAVLEMAGHKKAAVRYNAMWSVRADTPAAVLERVLTLGLEDRSKRIRALAADRIMMLNVVELLPRLEAAVVREADPSARALLECTLQVTRDGYVLRRVRPGWWSLSYVWTSEDGSIRSFGGPTVSQAELDEKGILGILAESRERNARLHATREPTMGAGMGERT